MLPLVLSGFTQGNWTSVPAGNTFVFTVFSAMLLILCQAHLFDLNFTHATFAGRIIGGFFFPRQRTELALKAREEIPFFSYAAMPVPDSCSTAYVSTKLSEKVTVKVFRESAHKEICYFHAADSQRTLDISPFDGTRISLAYGHPSQKSYRRNSRNRIALQRSFESPRNDGQNVASLLTSNHMIHKVPVPLFDFNLGDLRQANRSFLYSI